MYQLVIAEKPSVGMSLAKALGASQKRDGYMEGKHHLVSWCVGHLARLADAQAYDPKYAQWKQEDLPILPEQWLFTVDEKTRKQFDILRKLLQREDISEVINACDAGREGELIFRTIYHLAGCKKPVLRLWISSMEDSAIQAGFQNLKPGSDYDGLYQAALCRAQADWLVGINASRLFSILYHRTLHVGRVMSPTLALLVQRETQIQTFQATPVFHVEMNCGGMVVTGERLSEKKAAEEIADACKGQKAIVQKIERREIVEKPPALYDLTTLQRDANRTLGYTAQQTLDLLQSLYEKKLCTYPRTDSRYLTNDMEAAVSTFVSIAAAICGADGPKKIRSSSVCDSKQVTDHHALVPTRDAGNADLASLPLGEREILRLVSLGLLKAVSPPYRCAETSLVLTCAGHSFTAKGKSVLEPGWKIYDGSLSDQILPDVAPDTALTVESVQVKTVKTSPPAHLTEDRLLEAMEKAGADAMPEEAERRGIGTSATRAGILEKLVSSGLMERSKGKKGTALLPTATGTALIAVLPENLQSPRLTAEWERRLMAVERGELEANTFLKEISSLVQELTATYQPAPGSEKKFPIQKKIIGTCPRCGGAVLESRKGFFCENSNCRFMLWKENYFFTNKKKTLTQAIAARLLRDGRAELTGCWSEKTGKTYDATVILEDDGEKTKYRLTFEKEGKK